MHEALKMYLEGYTAWEIKQATGLSTRDYSCLITEHVKELHDEAHKKRVFMEDFGTRWDEARFKILEYGKRSESERMENE